MKRSWIALALLSISWLVGVGYYHHVDKIGFAEPGQAGWWVFVVVALLLLLRFDPVGPTKGLGRASLLILLPVLLMTSWPVAVGPILLAVGLLIFLIPLPRRWPKAVAIAATTSGIVLTAQAAAIFAYQSLTARSHELPAPLPELLGLIARLIGIDASADGTTVALHTMRKLQELGATWDFFFDPATFCFLFGGIALLVFRGTELPAGGRHKPIARACLTLIVCVVVWLPVRAGLLMALLNHRALRTEFESPLILMDQFRNTWVLLTLLIGPTALAARFVSLKAVPIPAQLLTQRLPAIAPVWKRWAAAGAALAGVFTLAFAFLWDPAGITKPGRIIIDEVHSKWEPTQRPFDTTWYGHDSGYNYAVIFDYLSKFYTVQRNEAHITDATLANCDVFISKVPTSRYEPDEIDTLERFVRRGGGLALVGEHTDVFGTGVSLNDISRRFGFEFRYDVILDTDTSFEQKLLPNWAPHPAIQHVGDFDFAVTCSIDPGLSLGRAAIISHSLRSLGPDYHASNFYPQIDDTLDERYGAFVQAWATRAGNGRVFAWADSTIWSNFCTFEPGKIEMLMGITQWLNQSNRAVDLRPVVGIVGLLFLVASLILARNWSGAWLPMLSAGLLGWTLSAPAIHYANWQDPKERNKDLPFHRVVIDRTVCDTPLSRGGFIDGKPNGFGVFERWILRLGYYITRASGDAALKDDLIVFTYPSKDVPDAFRAALVRYVRDGGKVLVIDAPENATSTANSLLYPFQLEEKRSQALAAGDLTVRPGWTSTRVTGACEIVGGESIVQLDGKTVGATTHFGKGQVTALAFGARLTDPSMGVTGDTMPDDDLNKTYAFDYALMRWLVEGKEPPPSTQPASTEPAATQSATTEPVAPEPPATLPATMPAAPDAVSPAEQVAPPATQPAALLDQILLPYRSGDLGAPAAK